MNYHTRHNTPRRIIADDGRELPVTTFEPEGAPRGVILVAPAMATRSTYYAPFAAHLALRGWRVVTFDYRGMRSRADMKLEAADLNRWFADVRSILTGIADEAGELPVTLVGHSLGGQLIPFIDHTRLASVITIASGDGYWRRNPPGVRRIAPLLWSLVVPVSVSLAGYYPGNRLNLIGDLPANAMRQWARWCLHPEYLRRDHPEAPRLFAQVKAPIMSLSFTDDAMMSAESTKHLHDWYSGVDVVHQRFTPEQLDGRKIGHHGFFRPQNADLWTELVEPWVGG